MNRYQDSVINEAGVPVPSVTVTVRVAASPAGSGALATLYSDDGVTSLANPLTADAQANFYFYAGDGRYDIVISGGSPAITPFTIADVEIADRAGELEKETDDYAGADLGVRINAADADLGANSGTIVVGAAGTISTAVILSDNHRLHFRAPVTVSNTITLGNGCSVVGDGYISLLTLSFGSPGNVILATTKTDIAVENVHATSTSATNAYRLFYVVDCDRVYCRNNYVYKTELIHTASSGANYAAVTDGNSCHDVQVVNNICDGAIVASGSSAAINLTYVRRGIVSGNTVYAYAHGMYYWGGDANANGALANERKAVDLVFSGNTVRNTYQGGIWGSMGDGITITGNTVDTCGDLCIDVEGTFNAAITGNYAKDGTNACLATFFKNRNVVFSGNTVIVSNDAYPPARINHDAVDTTNKDVQFIANTFYNADTSDIAAIIVNSGTGPVEHLIFKQNGLRNVRVDFTATNQRYIEVVGNSFVFDQAASVAIKAIDVSSYFQQASEPAHAIICGNTIVSSVTQPAGSIGINVEHNDSNAAGLALIEGNVFGGQAPFPTDITFYANSSNAGIASHAIIRDNLLAIPLITITENANLNSNVFLIGNRTASTGVPYPAAVPANLNTHWDQGQIRIGETIGTFLQPVGSFAGNVSTMGLGYNLYWDETAARWKTRNDGVSNGGSYIGASYGSGSEDLRFYIVPHTGATNQSITNSGLAAYQRVSINTTGLHLVDVIPTYKNISTVAHGIPSEYAQLNLTAQAGSIGTAILYAVPVGGAGMYRISYYLITTTAGNAETVLATFGWNDGEATQSIATATIAINSDNDFEQGQIMLYSAASQNITYATTASGALGTGRYALYVRMEAL